MKNQEMLSEQTAERERGGRRGRRHGSRNDFRQDERPAGRRFGRGSHEGGRGGHHGGRRGGRRGRARRGEARYILLDVLRDGPKHGYEMIKTLEERSGGQYVPSPGTVYPTLQYLEDQGLVRAEQDAERRVYSLTEAGAAELETQAAAIDEFWARFEAQSVTTNGQPEVGFLEEELAHLNRTVWSGLRSTIAQNDLPTLRRVREAVETCQRQVREIIANEYPTASETPAAEQEGE